MITKVNLVFKTHLDIGFTALAAEIEKLYFDEYIPRALATARTLRERGGSERFIWTTGSWLIYTYLEQAIPRQRAEMESAITAGDIAWHGLPFTTHTELMDASLFEFGLSLSQELDRRFGRQTIAAKMTDVPGHTRGIVPLLSAAGIRFLHIGVNEASRLPDVPPVFRWQSPDGSEVMVMYEQGYGRIQSVPGLDQALAFGHTTDNLGPQTPEQVLAIYDTLRAQFPGADIQAARLDDFTAALETVRGSLPVVTAEIGDTWIHGVGSDPVKVSRFRELLRLRRAWLERGASNLPALRQFSRRLLMVPEHTWGMDEKTFLADSENYIAHDFHAALQTPNYQAFAASWAEQRAYLDQAVESLDGTPLAEEARAALSALQPVRPNLKEWKRMLDPGLFDSGALQIRFDMLSGGLNLLRDTATGRDWASSRARLGVFRYQTFSAQDYERFFEQYITLTEENRAWAVQDFTKPGMEKAGAERRMFLPSGVEIYRQPRPSGQAFLVQLSFPTRASASFGCPRRVFLEWFFPTGEPRVEFTVRWFDKYPSRLPEAVWLSFVPAVSPGVEVWMDKLGQPVSPLEVISNGNRRLHAVGSGVTVRDGQQMEILTRDAPLVAPGDPSLLDFNNALPDLTRGLHFNLYNNVWGTNFPMWSADDGFFRFELRFTA